MEILDCLNEEQREALLAIDGAVLVTAGAGTGKTRLLTHRIAYMIENLHVDPYNILAITFTNKAANEMKTRVEKLVSGGNRVWISTFHSMCVKILRQDIEKLGGNYTKYFTIYSDTDSEKLVKQILKEFQIDEDPKRFLFHISNCKNKNMTLEQYEKEFESVNDIDTVMRVFREYERNLINNNALDFDDLLTKTYKLFVTCPEVLEYYITRFQYVLVDEFQDTNKIQYDLTKLLCLKYKNLFVVGDEDQSIYSWRGADFTNIFNITKDFPGAKVFKLQRNYRCTKDILSAANQLIALNKERFGKKLWTDKENSVRVSYKKYYDEQEEANNVASTIYRLVEKDGYLYSDIAILVRLNALTMPFEEKLLTYNIPHKIYGGFKFFERAEIKNILSYLRIFINKRDEVSLLRIINFPKRSIGDAAISLLKKISIENDICLLDVVLQLEKFTEARGLLNKLKEFKDIYEELEKDLINYSLDDFVIRVIEKFKIKDVYFEKNEENTDKLLNIDQLVNSVKNFCEANSGATLSEYLESVTLQSDIDTLGDSDNVTVASVHAVKGLEFKIVFVVGMEDGIFPLSRCKDNNKDLEEERRLAYVAYTRAGERLYVSSCQTRFIYGRRGYQKESQFVSEAGLGSDKPKRIFTFDDFDNFTTFNNSGYNTKVATAFIPKPGFNKSDIFANKQKEKSSVDLSKYKVGQTVEHPKFGVGKIMAFNDGGKTADINFNSFGVKTLLLEIAPLKIIFD